MVQPWNVQLQVEEVAMPQAMYSFVNQLNGVIHLTDDAMNVDLNLLLLY